MRQCACPLNRRPGGGRHGVQRASAAARRGCRPSHLVPSDRTGRAPASPPARGCAGTRAGAGLRRRPGYPRAVEPGGGPVAVCGLGRREMWAGRIPRLLLQVPKDGAHQLARDDPDVRFGVAIARPRLFALLHTPLPANPDATAGYRFFATVADQVLGPPLRRRVTFSIDLLGFWMKNSLERGRQARQVGIKTPDRLSTIKCKSIP